MTIPMSAIGTKRTSPCALTCPLMTQSGFGATRQRPANASKLLLHKNKIKASAKLYSDPWHSCCFNETKVRVKLE